MSHLAGLHRHRSRLDCAAAAAARSAQQPACGSGRRARARRRGGRRARERRRGGRRARERRRSSTTTARRWARTGRTTRPPSPVLGTQRAGREAPLAPAGPLPAPSRRRASKGTANQPEPRTTATKPHADGHQRTGRRGRRLRRRVRSERAEWHRTYLQGHCEQRADERASQGRPPAGQTPTITRVRRDVRRGADGQPTAGQDDIFRVKGATQPGRSRLVADGAGSQCDGNAWTRGWWHRPTPTFDEHLASTVVGSVEGESAISRHQKSTATS